MSCESSPRSGYEVWVQADIQAQTIDEFNAAVNDKEFDLMKLDGKRTNGLKVDKTNWANKIEKAPFYGYNMYALPSTFPLLRALLPSTFNPALSKPPLFPFKPLT